MSHLAPTHLCLRALRSTFERAIDRARHLGHPVVMACSVDLDPVDPLQVLAAWDDGATPYLYWESRDAALTFLAWGCALELTAEGEQRFAQITREWKRVCGDAVTTGPLPLHLCGGLRFDPRSPHHPLWRSFGDASLMLASITVVCRPDHHQLLFQHLVEGDDDALSLAAQCCLGLWPSRRRTEEDERPLALDAAPALGCTDRSVWEAKVEEAVRQIRQGHLDKVVLARAHGPVPGSSAPWRVLQHLRGQQGDAHLFACRRGQACFLGASPERLAQVRKGLLRTHALAGTTGRSQDPQEDARLGQALLDSPKERHEHRLVVDAILTALRPHCKTMEVSGTPELKRLARVQHLNTPIRAQLKRDAGLLGVIEALHPTPAVGGQPRGEALDHIRQHEDLDRGWYASPIGWLDGDGDGDFLVALRSALLHPGASHLFAGCGIVSDSEPRHEYEETCLKLSMMQGALIAAGKSPPGGDAVTVERPL